jgi:hypothetical protein
MRELFSTKPVYSWAALMSSSSKAMVIRKGVLQRPRWRFANRERGARPNVQVRACRLQSMQIADGEG